MCGCSQLTLENPGKLALFLQFAIATELDSRARRGGMNELGGSQSPTSRGEFEMPVKARKRWTVLIYMVADDPQGGELLDREGRPGDRPDHQGSTVGKKAGASSCRGCRWTFARFRGYGGG